MKLLKTTRLHSHYDMIVFCHLRWDFVYHLAIVYIPGDGFSAKKIDLKNKCLKPLNKEFPILTIPEGEIIETRGVVKTIFREVKNLD